MQQNTEPAAQQERDDPARWEMLNMPTVHAGGADVPEMASVTAPLSIVAPLLDANFPFAPLSASSTRRPASQQRRRAITIAVVLGLLLGVVAPLGYTAFTAYSTYKNLKALALDGVKHLEAVKAKLPTSTSDLSPLLNATTLTSLHPDIVAAQNDFTQLNAGLNGSWIIGLAGGLPGLSGKVTAARHLAHIGVDITQMATILVDSGTSLVNILHRSPLDAKVPFLTQTDLTTITNALNAVTPLLNDIAAQAHGVDLGSLLSSSQQALLDKVLTGLPQIDATLGNVRQFLQIAPALLGLTTPASYLVVTMDRSELRASGGFQGNYALTTVAQGRLTGDIKLNDTYLLDEKNGQCWNYNSVAPAAYQSWWQFSCWGLRDANLSADFPTTARTSIQEMETEGGAPVAGMIALTPKIIQQVLKLTGPITIGLGYNVTVTPDNLEALIHQFQLTHSTTGGDLPPPDQLSSERKRFTALLGRALQDRLHGLKQDTLIALARDAIEDLKSKDIQFYSLNPAVEQFFAGLHLDSAMQRGAGDAVFVVDTNLSGKQNTYVQEAIKDSVQLDATGGATHTLTLTYDFKNPTHAPTYGYVPGYRDYLRVYLPSTSTFISSDTSTITHMTSDELHRAMWAGFLDIPENGGPVTVTLRWHVPNAVAKSQPYTLDVQKQAGNHVVLSVTISKAGVAKPVVSYTTPTKDQFMVGDVGFTVV